MLCLNGKYRNPHVSKNIFTSSVYFAESTTSRVAKAAVSPTYGRVSKIVAWLVWPLVVGGGLCIRSEALGIKEP